MSIPTSVNFAMSTTSIETCTVTDPASETAITKNVLACARRETRLPPRVELEYI